MIYLDSIGVADFGMSRSQGVDLSESLEVIQRQLIAKEMEKDVLQRTGVSNDA